jgi:hypothetical protein
LIASYLVRRLLIIVKVTSADSTADAKSKDSDIFNADDNKNDKKSIIKRQEALAKAFHERMAEGQTYERTGKYREKFFDKVIKKAEKVSFSTKSP